MQVIKQILKDFGRFFSFKTRNGRIRLAVLLIVLIGAAVFISKQGNGTVEESPTPSRTVMVGTVNSLTANNGFSLIGTVASKNQADIKSEASGRVTSVPVTLGQRVAAGAMIAQLENASQYAAVLQAEGAYDAAQAAANQSAVSVSEAASNLEQTKRDFVTSYKNAYTSSKNALVTDIDVFFRNADQINPTLVLTDNEVSASYQSLRRAAEALRGELNNDLIDWNSNTVSVSVQTNNLIEAQQEVADNTDKIVRLYEMLLALIDTQREDTVLEGVNILNYRSSLLNGKSEAVSLLNALNDSYTKVGLAEDTLNKAQLGGSNSEASAAQAQLKQALGSLRAAQAMYNKTIIRTPIAGTVNELKIKTGDYIGQFEPIALVANNNALEITTYVGEFDSTRVSVGQAVLINGSITGTVTAIAPAIDSVTKKTEMKIGTESDILTNGDTVTITFPSDDTTVTTTSAPLLVPIEAVKFTAQDGSIFTVVEGRLVAVPVKLGPIVGAYVTIAEGIDANTEFVLDGRGLTAGSEVEAIR